MLTVHLDQNYTAVIVTKNIPGFSFKSLRGLTNMLNIINIIDRIIQKTESGFPTFSIEIFQEKGVSL